MSRIILVLSLIAAFGILYSFLVNKFFSSKLLLFFPSIIGLLWFVYIFTLFIPKSTEGFGDLAIVIYSMMIFSFMLGNILSSIYMIYKQNKKPY